jgi:hypothetical protein
MSTWQEEGARAAREMNERMRQENNARASVAPINEVNQTLKEIKALLIEIRNSINTKEVLKSPPYPLGWATLGVPVEALDLD